MSSPGSQAPALNPNEPPGRDFDLGFKRDVGLRLALLGRGFGASAWVVELTLATGATSTTVGWAGVSSGCQISLEPLTAAAAALLGKVWVPSATLTPARELAGLAGSFVVQHPNLLAGTVATFRASVKG